jgi:hypothetical protein
MVVNRNRDRTACKVQRLVIAVGGNVLCMVSSRKERDRLRRQVVIKVIIHNNTFVVEFNAFCVGFIVGRVFKSERFLEGLKPLVEVRVLARHMILQSGLSAESLVAKLAGQEAKLGEVGTSIVGRQALSAAVLDRHVLQGGAQLDLQLLLVLLGDLGH